MDRILLLSAMRSTTRVIALVVGGVPRFWIVVLGISLPKPVLELGPQGTKCYEAHQDSCVLSIFLHKFRGGHV